MITLLVFTGGVVVGVIFHATLAKYFKKAKEAGKQIVTDLKEDADRLKTKA